MIRIGSGTVTLNGRGWSALRGKRSGRGSFSKRNAAENDRYGDGEIDSVYFQFDGVFELEKSARGDRRRRLGYFERFRFGEIVRFAGTDASRVVDDGGGDDARRLVRRAVGEERAIFVYRRRYSDERFFAVIFHARRHEHAFAGTVRFAIDVPAQNDGTVFEEKRAEHRLIFFLDRNEKLGLIDVDVFENGERFRIRVVLFPLAHDLRFDRVAYIEFLLFLADVRRGEGMGQLKGEGKLVISHRHRRLGATFACARLVP